MISFRRRSAFLCVAVLSICACTLSAEPGTIYVDTSTAAAADGALRHEPVRSPNTAVDDSPSTTLSGVLEALVIDDFAQGTAEMRYYLRSDDGTSLKIHFSAAPRLRPGARFTVAGQMMGEVFFASTYHEMSPSVSMLAYSVSEDEHVVGEQGTLVLLFNFQDAPNSQPATVAEVEDMVFNASDPVSVNFMLQENSYGKTWLSGDVLGWLTLPINAANCFPTYIGTRTGLQNVIDFVDSQVNFSLYRRIILIHSGDGCLSGGAGSFGEWSIQTDEGALEMSMATTRLDGGISIFTARTILHELGHNFKIPHQDDLECGEAVVGDYADGCDPINRGNRYDHMANNTTGHDNASTKHRLGWFDPQNIAELGTAQEQELQINGA